MSRKEAVSRVLESNRALAKDLSEHGHSVEALLLLLMVIEAEGSLEAKPPVVEGPHPRPQDTYCWDCGVNVSMTATSKPTYCQHCGAEFDWYPEEEESIEMDKNPTVIVVETSTDVDTLDAITDEFMEITPPVASIFLTKDGNSPEVCEIIEASGLTTRSEYGGALAVFSVNQTAEEALEDLRGLLGRGFSYRIQFLENHEGDDLIDNVNAYFDRAE